MTSLGVPISRKDFTSAIWPRTFAVFIRGRLPSFLARSVASSVGQVLLELAPERGHALVVRDFIRIGERACRWPSDRPP